MRSHWRCYTVCSYSSQICRYICYTSACSNAPSLGAACGGRIPDSSFSATSHFRNLSLPKYGRLSAPRHGWEASTPINMPNEYLQIDLGGVYWVCSVTTQGRFDANEWTTKYKISLSLDDSIWNIYQRNLSDIVKPITL